jgi:hypothetical protein
MATGVAAQVTHEKTTIIIVIIIGIIVIIVEGRDYSEDLSEDGRITIKSILR